MIQTPVTVIAGETGSGKTTLITKLIRAHPALKFAVLVNRRDRSMQDVETITDAGGRCIPVLGGCICCSLGDSFVGAMLQITAVRDLYDHILIEACGEAEPAKVMEFAQADPELEAKRIIITSRPDQDAPPFAEQADVTIAWGTEINPSALIA